ncbi:MAG TPA: TonB-dependent receptor, partial [Gemmatimonadaceae bacterium]
MSLRRLFLLAAAFLGAAAARPTSLHAQTDVIRGRITGPDSLPIERARITVTSLSGNVSRSTQTDKNGRFTVAFPGDEGDYFVNVAALGFASKRFEVKRTADQEVLIADARLSRVATQLDAVKVQADRQKAARDNNAPDVSGSERQINPGGISASQMGDLAALAASLPGVQLIPGADGTSNGFSVLGLDASQNATTLNGMNFGGSNLPRDANISTSLSTATYDVSRGNYSGGLLNVRMGRASNFIIRSSSLYLDAPQMQWTDAAARALGQQYMKASLGGSVMGPLIRDKAFYNFSYQVGRQQNDLQSLLNTDGLGLRTIGLASDSVRHLLSTLGTWGLPTTTGAIPNNRLQDQASLLTSIDFIPPTSVTGQAFNVTVNAGWNRQNPSGSLTTELPSHSGERSNWNVAAFGKHSSYFGFGILTETSLGFNRTRNNASPYLEFPNGSVRVNSTFADGTSSVQSIGFGGNPAMNIGFTTTGAQLMNQLSWFSENNKHRLKFTTELRRDEFSQDVTTNQLGTFTFNSLADLDAGRPASYSRQLSPRVRSQDVYVAGMSLGDSYRPSDDLQIQYGLRVDGNRFGSGPLFNSDVERIFHARNDNVPNKYYFSPRIGFSYTLGTASQVAAFDG